VNYYPIYLDIRNKKCVVIGGGEVAERKVRRLLECDADISVIAKAVTPALDIMIKEGRIHRIDDEYNESYIRDAFLVIGATDQNDINARISWDAQEKRLLVNIVDDPDRCNFILPSLLKQGELSIAISTGGKSPALAKKLRQDMEGIYGPEYKTLLGILGNLRQRILGKGQSPDENKRLFESLVDSDILHLIREKDWCGVNKLIFDITGEDIEAGE
jgi:precorrin-2 dehydrogenase / sirohydrochlorin ferrochelatase